MITIRRLPYKMPSCKQPTRGQIKQRLIARLRREANEMDAEMIAIREGVGITEARRLRDRRRRLGHEAFEE